MSFNLESFKSKLKEKGIEINASATEVVAFSWSVEGIEKVPKLGEVLFYKVNGVEYGVKPKKGNKHDIHWYYDQLKTGMKGAKGYAAGLVQFLNVWVKKTKELVIVYKGGKVVESGFDGEVCTASSQLVSETGIANLLYDMKIKANKWNHGATGICWDVVLKDNKALVIEYLEDEGVANITYRNGSTKKDIKGIKTVNDLRSKLHKCLSEINASKVTADLEEGENPETEILAFIDDVNGLTIRGKRVFNAEKKDDDIVINLLLKHFETPDMDRLNGIVEDKLEILFPITQKWMDADKGKTFGNTKKVGDIVLYADEWSSQEFADHLTIEQCSKIDWKDLPYELHSLYKVLERDCAALETNLFKVTADVCEVKETLGEINEENFKGIGTENDRLLYKKVSAKDFINLWRTSTEFNPSQLSKIIFGFKLASRILGSKFEKSGINIGYFFKKADGKGYIRVEYKDSLYIIYVSQSDENGDIKVVTRKMRKMIPVKNFNLLSTSVSSLAFENATLPPGFKKVWEEVTKD